MRNRRVLVLGVTGMLGNAVFRYLSENTNMDVFGTLRNYSDLKYFSENRHKNLFCQVDLLNQDDIIRTVSKIMPDVIINCVGLIKQLSHSNNPLSVLPVNSLLPHRLANIAGMMDMRLIHISTDCVFSGAKGNYTESEQCDAIDLYGISKKIGEVVDYPHAITLRTSIVGHELNSNYALINWFLSQEQRIKGFRRAIFSGLPTVELARVIHEYVIPNIELHGLYHVSSEPIDKYTLLSLVAEAYEKNIEITLDEDFVIDRSLNSSRFNLATGYIPPTWSKLINQMKNFG